MHPDQRPADTDSERPRVLLVDPHEQTRTILAQLLLREGCTVVAAAPNYAQAIVAARTKHPTVIVTELYDGTALTPEQYIVALKRYSPAPVIVHSVIVPDAFQVKDWSLWGTVVKGAEPPSLLLDTIYAAHTASRSRVG
jgi:DNA-binding NarL/FixJ family response regulator